MSDSVNVNDLSEINDIELEADALIASLSDSPAAAPVAEVEVLADLDEADELDEEESDELEETEEVAPPAPKGPLFSDFNFAPAVKKSIEQMGFEVPTDVQRQAIPKVLEGKDVLVTAQTGSGKTAAFLTPILTKMLEAVDEKPARFRRALIIAPTRELAEQIGQVARDLTYFSRRFRYAVVIGGSAYGRQLQQLRDRPAFVIGTPGRLIDHIDRGTLKLENFDFLVLDEADRMLDMGFEPQIEEIVKALPEKRQTMMFSATLPPEVKRLVSRYLKDPVRISVGEENRAVSTIKQDVVEVREGDKEQTLLREIDKLAGTMIIFTRTKMKADRVSALLNDNGHQADALHGDLTQGARRRVTQNFRDERIRILVATDIASRGLDIDHIQHVVNYDLPMVTEDYIHRIGRTGRAGREGHSIAFVTPADGMKWARICKMQGLPAPRGGGGYSRDRGGRRNDGKFAGPRPEGRGFRDRGDERPARPAFQRRDDARPAFARRDDTRPAPAAFARRDDTRPAPAAFARRDDTRPAPAAFQRREDSRPAPKAFERREDSRPARPTFQRRDDARPEGGGFKRREEARPAFARRDEATPRPAKTFTPRIEQAESGPARSDGFEKPVKRAWAKDGGARQRDDSHKRLPFKREGDTRPARSTDVRGEGPKVWKTDAPKASSLGDTRPKRFAKPGMKARDENWGRPWDPRGPVKKKVDTAAKTQRY
ncbi:MAG: DEAD/DEAH box helicase [Bdellovibrionota bacterium]